MSAATERAAFEAGLPLGWVIMPLSRLLPDLAAVPVAPPTDERQAFETWAYTKGWRNFTRDEATDRYVVEGDLDLRWIGWQARSALAAASAPKASQS